MWNKSLYLDFRSEIRVRPTFTYLTHPGAIGPWLDLKVKSSDSPNCNNYIKANLRHNPLHYRETVT